MIENGIKHHKPYPHNLLLHVCYCAIYYWILFIIGYYAADRDFALYRIFNIDYNKIIAIIETKKMESENAIAMFEERKQMTISSSPPRYRKQPKERITLIGGKKGKLFYFLQITC